MDDRELLQVLQKNPENGMRLVMKEYTGLCYYIVKQKLADFSAEEIEECVSDVFLAFYHQYTAIDLERGSIKGFLAVLSRRKAVDRWRKLAGKETLPLQEEITAADTLEQQEDRQILLDAVRALGPGRQNIASEILLRVSVKNDCRSLWLTGKYRKPENTAQFGEGKSHLGRRCLS